MLCIPEVSVDIAAYGEGDNTGPHSNHSTFQTEMW